VLKVRRRGGLASASRVENVSEADFEHVFTAASPANVPSVLAYQATNTVTHTKKSVSAAIVIGMGGVGGILASTVYRQADFPRYM